MFREKRKDGGDLAAKAKQMDKLLRILIVSGYTLWRESVRRLLDNSGFGMVVIGEAGQGSDAATKVAALKPDILILDFVPSGLDVFDLLGRVRKIQNVQKVVLIGQIGKQDLARALELGVQGVVSEQSPLEELIRCIRWIAAGGTWIRQIDGTSPSTPAPFRASPTRSTQAQFCITHREMEILEAVVAGCTNKEIASRLLLSVETVKHHVTNIFNKTGASNRLELALFAVEKRLVKNSQPSIGVTAPDAVLQRKQSA
jgi:two-component system nitrate/nitrite response regulator NarL